jgi:hypothetical protein
MELAEKTDTEILAVANPIMDNLMAGSDAIDFGQHTRDFTDRAKEKLTPELLECVCRASQSARGSFGSRDPVAVFRRPESVAVVWRQRFTSTPGDYVAEMVLVQQHGRYLVDHVMVF